MMMNKPVDPTEEGWHECNSETTWPKESGRYLCWVREGSCCYKYYKRKVMFIKEVGWRGGDWCHPLQWRENEAS